MAKALFLDRDGVINEENREGYILSREDFKFMKGALEAIVQLSKQYDYLIIVTNQRGIGRKLMSSSDLQEIHTYFTEQVLQAGGKVSAIYFAPSLESDHPLRKPNTGMALEAKENFPDIDFSQSVMVGNNLSDMEFGKRMGMRTVFLHTTQPLIPLPHSLIDQQFDSLQSFAVEG